MRRFLIAPDGETRSPVELSAEESHHITRVLRLAAGDEIELFDGQGHVFRGRIERVGRRVVVLLLSRLETGGQEGAGLYLFQADLKSKKMDLVVQKATELGVDRLFPFTCSRSQGRAGKDRREHRAERWRKLIEEACKQSMRVTLMKCEEESSLPDAINRVTETQFTGLKLLFWEKEPSVRLADIDWTKPYDKVCIMLGPEGGFSEEEVALACDRGWQTITLGSQVLRAETASITAISIVQHYLGRI